MKKNKSRRKLNNRGMSLIEILVAILILAVVAGPLLHALATSISLNTRAKEKQRVITIAQSIMEGLKAYDVEQICRQFNGDSMHLVANAGEWMEITDRNGDGEIDDNDVSFNASGNFLPSPNDTYRFVLTGVEYENVNHSEFYDVLIDISPMATSQAMLGVADMNKHLDAVYRQESASMDQTMYAQIMQNLLDELNDKNKSGDTFDLHDLETMGNLAVNKVTTVMIDKVGGKSTNIVTVKVEYNYKATGYQYTDAVGESKTLDFEGTELWKPEPEKVYDNTQAEFSEEQLENVYIFYYPAYKVNKMNISDEIVLQNKTASEKNVYLVKQVNSSLSSANLLYYEYVYSVKVRGEGPITLYHNLDINLENPDPNIPAGTRSISGVTEGGSMLTETQEVLLYDVTIYIYKAGSAENGFPDENQLLEFNGSIND